VIQGEDPEELDIHPVNEK